MPWTPVGLTKPYTVKTPTIVTGKTPIVTLSTPGVAWYSGLATIKTGATPTISLAVSTSNYLPRRGGAGPTISWSVPQTGWGNRSGSTPGITWSVATTTWSLA